MDCLSVRVCTSCGKCLWKLEEGVESAESRKTSSYEPLYWCWKPKAGPVEMQQVILTVDSLL